MYHFPEGYTNQVIVLDVGGEVVIISIESPAGKFEEFLPRAREVVDTIRWGA